MTYQTKRRTSAIGNPMMVNLPSEIDGYKSTGEGGLAFFFLIPEKEDERRQVCCAGGLVWPTQDVVITKGYRERTIDGGLLVGSIGLSLWSDAQGGYFEAKYENLTEEGQGLFNFLSKIYGKVDIVTLLDT